MLRIVLAAVLLPVMAMAAPQKSCPPLGTLPGYAPDEAQVYVWRPMDFRRKVAGSDDVESFEVAGRTCQITYAIESGKDPMSDLEIQTNYRQNLQKLGAVIGFTDENNTFAVLNKGGVETWFHVYSQETSLAMRVLQVGVPKMTLLPPSGNDYRLIGHMPGYVADKPEVRNFNKMDFTVRDGEDAKTVGAQGRTVMTQYAIASGSAAASDAEIHFNFRESLKGQGAEILFADTNNTTARLLSNGQVVWIKIHSEETSYAVHALEEKPFEPSIKPTQGEIRGALEKAGRVSLYVNFDFDRATLRPDAAAVVAQVAAMLKADPKLRVAVEGHTDGMGTAARNLVLSSERAKAFADAVAAQGIAADRMQSAGFGPDKPVATNETSEGRAQNRRVELVRL